MDTIVEQDEDLRLVKAAEKEYGADGDEAETTAATDAINEEAAHKEQEVAMNRETVEILRQILEEMKDTREDLFYMKLRLWEIEEQLKDIEKNID